MSAWDVFATAHRDADVSYRFLVIDEAGEYRVDRLVPGNNWLYNHSNTRTILHEHRVAGVDAMSTRTR